MWQAYYVFDFIWYINVYVVFHFNCQRRESDFPPNLLLRCRPHFPNGIYVINIYACNLSYVLFITLHNVKINVHKKSVEEITHTKRGK